MQQEEERIQPENISGGYQYDHEAQKEDYNNPRESGHFDHFQFDRDRVGRPELLEERLTDLYHGEEQRNPSLWSEAIKKCLETEDFKDARVIAALLSMLIQMRGLCYAVWDILEQELFCYRDDGAEWIWLQTQFMKMREEDMEGKKIETPVKQERMEIPQVDSAAEEIMPKESIRVNPRGIFNSCILQSPFCFLLLYMSYIAG